MNFKRFLYSILIGYLAGVLSGCSGENREGMGNDAGGNPVMEVDPMTNKGIGPVKALELGALDQAMADEGKKLYDAKCTACHNINTRLIGPPQAGVLKRRTPEWVMNMILNPTVMIKEDPIAKALLTEYNNVPMTEQGVTEEEARKILEYFRTM